MLTKRQKTARRAKQLAKDPDHFDPVTGKVKRGRPPAATQLGWKQEDVIKVIHAERGLLNEIALTLGTSRRLTRNYIMRNRPVAEALREAREAMGDIAEKKLYELIEAGDVRCITYYLSTVHKARGYGIKRGDALDPMAPVPTHVQTINILAIPSGQYVSPGDVERLAVEHGVVLNGTVTAADANSADVAEKVEETEIIDLEPPLPPREPDEPDEPDDESDDEPGDEDESVAACLM